MSKKSQKPQLKQSSRKNPPALENMRKKIDQLDDKIIDLLNERTEYALSIGKLKNKKGAEVYSPDRESEIYSKLGRYEDGALPPDGLKAIYREIMSASLALERPLKIAFLGPEATFTHLASLSKFGSSVSYLSCSTISEVFSEVEKRRADYGVVPIENSTEGSVTHTLDMFMDSDLKICSEILLPIVQNLISRCPLDKIKKIYSHPNVFGQCRMWLEAQCPGIEIIETSSTTRAAQIASKETNAAAIASRLAGESYRLPIIRTAIQDKGDNVTRFLVIGKQEVEPTGYDKTSIMFSVKDSVGVLHAMLGPFRKHKINLTKIESRPSRKKIWEYVFFIDLVGHEKQSSVTRALRELNKHCVFLKVLGSYPRQAQILSD